MFLTVTLNAAIDKTLRVANLQIGRRHRCAPGDPAGRRQGHQRRTRAAGARSARRRHRARGRSRRRHDRRGSHRRRHRPPVRAHRRRVALEHDRARPGRHAGRDRDRRVRAGRAPGRAGDVRHGLQLPAGRQRGGRAGRQPARATCPRTGTRRPCARRAGSASTPCSTPRASRCGSAWAASPISSCPTRWRPRSSSASSSRPSQDLVVALEQIVEMGARSVVITRDDGALAYVRESGRPLFLRATDSAARGRLAGGRGRRAAGGPPGRAPRRAPVRRGAAPRRRLRCREHPARAARNARSPRGAAAFGPGRSRRAHTCPSLSNSAGRRESRPGC